MMNSGNRFDCFLASSRVRWLCSPSPRSLSLLTSGPGRLSRIGLGYSWVKPSRQRHGYLGLSFGPPGKPSFIRLPADLTHGSLRHFFFLSAAVTSPGLPRGGFAS